MTKDLDRLQSLVDRVDKLGTLVHDHVNKMEGLAMDLQGKLDRAFAPEAKARSDRPRIENRAQVKIVAPQHVAPPIAKTRADYAQTYAGDDGELAPSEAAVLNAIAQFPSGATRGRVAVFSGRSKKSSTFHAAFPALVQKGLIQAQGEKYFATPAGQAVAGTEPLPSGPALLQHWMEKLTPAEGKVLSAIAGAYPRRVTREDVANFTGQSQLSSTFQAAFPALRDLELIEGTRDFLASDAFFA